MGDVFDGAWGRISRKKEFYEDWRGIMLEERVEGLLQKTRRRPLGLVRHGKSVRSVEKLVAHRATKKTKQ